MSGDITYCGYSNCPYKDCERHATHSKTTYDSFAYFHDCNKYPPMEFSQEVDNSMLTLDEAIKHCEEKEKEQALNGCFACAEEHKQLAEWLKELKAYKDAEALQAKISKY